MIPSPHNSARSNDSAVRRLSRPAGAFAVLAAAAIATVAGCSSSPHDSAAAQPSQAQHAIKLAASRSQAVDTLVASLTEHTSGVTTGGLTGTIAVRLRPTTLIDANFKIPSGKGKTIKLAEILTSKAIYFNDPAFTKGAGKSWVKLKISQLSAKTSVSVASLLQNLEGSNPLDQTRLFTASKDVKVAGSQTIGGIATTEYAGTYSPAKAFSELPAKLRTLLGPSLRAMGANPVRFRVWIDAQHLIRKATDTETVRHQTITTTFSVLSVNKPVTVRLPAPDQVAPMPKLTA
jgi:hypothetical protein